MALLLIPLRRRSPGPCRPRIDGPRSTEQRPVTYRFHSAERGLHTNRIRFRCRLDERPFRACRSRYTVTLSVGEHTLRVRAMDPRGRQSAVAKIAISVLVPRSPETRVGTAPLDVIAVGADVWTENYGDG